MGYSAEALGGGASSRPASRVGVTDAVDEQPPRLRLLSWNVQGHVKGVRDQIVAIQSRRPDLVALQEVTTTTVRRFQEDLPEMGLTAVIDSFTVADVDPVLLRGPRRYGLVVASRWPLTLVSRFAVPWPERVLSVDVMTRWGVMELHTTHIPPGVSNGWIKIKMLEGLFVGLACRSATPRVLCGDFNTPQEETSAGEIVTWAFRKKSSGRWVLAQSRGVRWDAGERNVLRALGDFDLADVYRSRHGYGRSESSWYWRRGNVRIGRRFDHVFAARGLNAVRCEYLHEFRERGLSDHAAIEVDFRPSRGALRARPMEGGAALRR